MGHPTGGQGNQFTTAQTFDQAYEFIRSKPNFNSTTGKPIIARVGKSKDGRTRTIVFQGENSVHGSVCSECWGYRSNCSGTHIGQCTEALDIHMSRKR
ncbi:hypothetical protein Gbem_4079 [Citrifermentans bemidjiense Bem]|uniref:Uncharacterized protein n=1 Tax=Citrifermentans bemidjiense (strain ATCC BAA-1014 / DSM 16622 / JCM 12645 / Bem) TaxID=404380 RepID=E1P687_CITBB|nr:hypothetical protein Gbem_4079 [Citrifermentans bemidjiense Bem]